MNQLLRDNVSLVSNRVFPPGVRQDSTMPRITLSQLTPRETFAGIGAGIPVWKNVAFKIDCWDKNPVNCEKVAEQVEQAIASNRNFWNTEVLDSSASGGANAETFGKTTWWAQSFTATTTGYLKNVKLDLNNQSGSGDVLVYLYSYNASTGPVSALASAKITGITGANATYTSTEFSKAPIVSGTHYFIVFCVPGTPSTGDFVFKDGTGLYADGEEWFSTNSGSTWSKNSGGTYDVNFSVYTTNRSLFFKDELSGVSSQTDWNGYFMNLRITGGSATDLNAGMQLYQRTINVGGLWLQTA
jgi:hypothetical protein